MDFDKAEEPNHIFNKKEIFGKKKKKKEKFSNRSSMTVSILLQIDIE